MKRSERWHAGLASNPSPMPRPQEPDEIHDFYQRWKSQIFGFFLLVGGDEEKAELLTAQTFVSYFRCGDSVAHHRHSHIPVALLRFASDLAGIQWGQHRGARSAGLTAALLALPLKERAVFIMISILRVQPSIAAVALRLRSGQLADHWTRAALRLRSSWLRSLELPVWAQRYSAA